MTNVKKIPEISYPYFGALMMPLRLIIVFSLLLLCRSNLAAQTEKKYPVKVGEIPDKVIPFEIRYAFPAFTEGAAELRNGAVSTYKFNYNYLLDEMQFISAAGDTLAIAEPATLKNVKIDSSVFYYNKGYIKVLRKNEAYILGVRKAIIQITNRSEGGYNTYSGAYATTTYGSVVSGNKAYALEVKKDALFLPVTNYFIGDAFGNFEKAGKKAFIEYFGEKKKDLLSFIKKNKINFIKEKDIIKLFDYCIE